jgi:hypothetical protein
VGPNEFLCLSKTQPKINNSVKRTDHEREAEDENTS